MMKVVVGLVLVITVGLAAMPNFRITAAQPWSTTMRTTYGILPTLGIGARFPRSEHLSVLMELAGTYARALPGSGETSLWSASLRTGLELNTGEKIGFYGAPGLMVTYASEQFPYADSMTHVISRRNYAGASIGAFLNAGVRLFRVRNWELGVESGLDLVSVPTNSPYPGSDYWAGYYQYWIDASTLNLGLVFRQSRPAGEK